MPRLLGAALALTVAGLAWGQGAQRLYVFPQRASLDSGQPAILVAMCLDPDVSGAPGVADPITRWDRPEAVVVRMLRDGQVVDTQSWSQLCGAANPWVRFDGASDIAGHVAIRVSAVQPEPGVTYEVEITEGTAAARPQEYLVGSYLAKLARYERSHGIIDRDLKTLRAEFPADALLTRVYEEFATATLWPAMSRDASPAEAERSTSRFVGRVEDALRDADRAARPLLAALWTGTSVEPSAGQRAFFEAHGISWGDDELSPDALAAVAQFRAAYEPTLLQACYDLCRGGTGADGFTLAGQALERLAEWQAAGMDCSGPEIAHALGPTFRVEFRGGESLLTRDTGPQALNLAQLVRRYRPVHDVLSDPKRRANLKKELLRLAARLDGPASPVRLPARFWELAAGDQTRRLALLGEELRHVPLDGVLLKLLRTGPPLAPALRVALCEARWLIDVRGLTARERETLQRHAGEFEARFGIACTLLEGERERPLLAVRER